MGMCGGKEQRELKWGDIELLTDVDGVDISHTKEKEQPKCTPVKTHLI